MTDITKVGRSQLTWYGEPIDLHRILKEIENDLIYQAMDYAGNSPVAAAKLLGLKRTTLRMKLRKLRLEAGE